MYFNNILDEILDVFKKYEIFTSIEIYELNKSIKITIEEYINNNINDIMNPEFDSNLTKYIYTLHLDQILHLYDSKLKDRVQYRICKIIKNKKLEVYSKLIPPRSYSNSFIRNIVQNKQHLSKKINTLKEIPQPNQRSDEWYMFRHNLLTASSIWKVFKSKATQNQLIYEKCKPYVNYGNNIQTSSPLHWGQKYEPVSIEFYKKLYKTEITDFGCIKHPKYSFIGASPDGINTDINNARYGRMLEIKNVVNRKINGIPKFEYWIQMQIQMETCDLNECDFLETQFIEYENENDFNKDGNFIYSNDNKLKGIIILFNNNGNTHYEYAPLYITKNEYEDWEKYILDKNSDKEWIQNIFWKLEKYSNVLVLRNKLWFNNIVNEIENLWNTVIKERVSGFEHRAPNRKKRSITSDIIVNKCHLNMEL
tara:strand:+ start:4006 stop:5274 length:1269 start_codon:yes stop_codon:yes gene_type:complete